MVENHLEGRVIGVAFDGTGYGPDGAIWGGEFLLAGYADFERRAHLRYIPLAGGDTAVRQPWRSAAGYIPPGVDLPGVPEAHLRTVRGMIATGTNTVPTSSCGRLFDAVAALTGLRREVTFEGQAAIELEAIADPACTSRYPFEFTGEDLDFRPMIDAILRGRESPPVVSARFHNTLAAAIHHVCLALRAEAALNRVCLSGGTFQNLRLLGLTTALLRASSFEVFLHREVPPNDGGLSLGQAAIAAARLAAAASAR
jgi:hydrogenase maturation protein HypF